MISTILSTVTLIQLTCEITGEKRGETAVFAGLQFKQ